MTMTMTMKYLYFDTKKLNTVDTCIMLIMLVIDILVCPEILLVHYDVISQSTRIHAASAPCTQLPQGQPPGSSQEELYSYHQQYMYTRPH